jgi:hypothetical protein
MIKNLTGSVTVAEIKGGSKVVRGMKYGNPPACSYLPRPSFRLLLMRGR